MQFGRFGKEGRMKKMHLFRTFTAVCMAFSMTFGNIGGTLTVSAAENAPSDGDYYPIEPVSADIPTYSAYYDKYASAERPDKIITINGADCISAENGEFSVGGYADSFGGERENCLIWESGGEVIYGFDTQESGNYCISVSFCPMISDSPEIEFSLAVDGEIPYSTASHIKLNRVWVNEKDISTDMRGNQIRPTQVQTEQWQETFLGDSDGLFSEPLFIHLEKGHHELTFTAERAEFVLESLTLCNQEKLPTYAEYAADCDFSGTGSFRLEGEAADFKSSSTLCPTSDSTSYLVSPSSPTKLIYNTLGGGNRTKSLQTVTWTIPQEKLGQGGWYKIGIRSRQNLMRGLSSGRRIYIDGKVPCKELDLVKFRYDNDWNTVSPKADGESVYVYLSGNSDHRLTLEAVTGEIGDSLRRLDGIVTELNTYYRRVMMITGASPDKYTDYYVHEKIPDLVDSFERISGDLKDIQHDIEALSDSEGSEAAVIGNMAVILDKCVERPLKIPNYLSQIKDSIAAVSAWTREYRDQPLEIDFIEFAAADTEFAPCGKKLMKSLGFGIKSFIGSFFEDYTTLSDVKGEDAIEVWVSLGRDQAQVVKEMTEEKFMQETGIPVAVNLVTGGVVEASLAGKSPDIALFLSGEFPVNLAARDMLVDLTQFKDYPETVKRFQKTATVPYTYEGGVYGLPISRSFPMMFCRTDILPELDITEPPETWDDLRDILPKLQRNYMSAGLVLPTANISPATESGHTFALMMLQNGMSYYNDDLTKSTFGTVGAVEAFEEWTDFYSKYSFSQFYDAFSRFRTGEYPIVIANYTFFNQLKAASPEIDGLWDFYPVPGTIRSDGAVSHAANSNGSGAVIFSKVKNADNAWEFVKWFTDTDTQAEYGRRIEGLLGTLGRFDTANTEALERLSWSDSELEKLTAQQSELAEIPIIPSSYAVTRNIMNAFREVVNEGENPRDTLMWYDRDINDEISRKQEQLRRWANG